MKKLFVSILTSLSIVLANSTSAFAGNVILASGTDDGGAAFIGNEKQAVLNAAEKINAICQQKGTSITNLNIHSSNCSWRRAGEIFTCQALFAASCNDGQSGNGVIAISHSIQTQDLGDILDSEARASQKAKQIASQKCSDLQGKIESSVESSLCDGRNDNDNLFCTASSIVACLF